MFKIANSISKLGSPKNIQKVTLVLFLLIFLWMIMFAIPQLFVSLFDTLVGNLVLLAIVALTAMYDVALALGLAIVFMILFRFSHMKSISYF